MRIKEVVPRITTSSWSVITQIAVQYCYLHHELLLNCKLSLTTNFIAIFVSIGISNKDEMRIAFKFSKKTATWEFNVNK